MSYLSSFILSRIFFGICPRRFPVISKQCFPGDQKRARNRLYLISNYKFFSLLNIEDDVPSNSLLNENKSRRFLNVKGIFYVGVKLG